MCHGGGCDELIRKMHSQITCLLRHNAPEVLRNLHGERQNVELLVQFTMGGIVLRPVADPGQQLRHHDIAKHQLLTGHFFQGRYGPGAHI